MIVSHSSNFSPKKKPNDNPEEKKDS